MAILPKNYNQLAQQNALDEGSISLQDLLNANKKEEEPIISQMAPADYERMQSSITPDMLYTTPKLSDILPEKQKPVLPDNYNQLTQQEAFDQGGVSDTTNLQKSNLGKAASTPISDLQKQTLTPPAEETDLQRLERKLQELRDLDLERQSTASKYNFGAKAAAIIGDALSKYQTGAIQKNVGAPVQFTGPSLQQMVSMIGEVKAPSSTEQRQALIDRYKEIKADQKTQNASKEAKAAAELKYKRDLAMLDRRLGAEKEIAFRKAAEPTFEEKEDIKARKKEELQINKENRAVKEKLDPAISNLDKQIKHVDKALQLLVNPKTGTVKSDLTGPYDQYKASFTEEGQALKDALSNISLTEMTKAFAGMSKAIDSDAERAFFQAAQPSLEKYENVNVEVLKEMKANLESLKQKSKSKLQEIEAPKQNQAIYGEFVERDGKSYRWNPSVNKYQLIPSK
jgi:hypothetical protein